MRLADSHAHIYDKKFNKDREEVIQRAKALAIEFIVVPSEDINSARKALELSLKYSDYIFPAVGFHPHDTTKFDYELLENEIRTNKYIAIGEIGLDYYYDKDVIQEQKYILRKQFELALKYKLPVILHVRDAFSDIFDILDEFPGLEGVFHCFTGGKEEAKEVLKRGLYISFSGIVTYKNADNIREAVKITPIEKILIETDSPYLSPVPMRGKRNEPSFIIHVLHRISEITGIPPAKLAETTFTNTKSLFKINV